MSPQIAQLATMLEAALATLEGVRRNGLLNGASIADFYPAGFALRPAREAIDQARATAAPAASAEQTPVEHLLLRLHSDDSVEGTDYYRAFVLPVTADLRARIDSAYAQLCADEAIHSIALNCMGIAVPGQTYLDQLDDAEKPTDELLFKLDEILDDINDLDCRPLRPGEFDVLQQLEARHTSSERVVVRRYSPPQIQLYEDNGGEGFSSGSAYDLQPAAQTAEEQVAQMLSRASDELVGAPRAGASA